MRFVACAQLLLLEWILPLPAVLLIGGAALALADQQISPALPIPPPQLEDSRQSAQQQTGSLGRGSFDQRQQAMWTLWRQRDSSGHAVRLAATDPDLEIAGRANWILDRWKRGILPELPSALSQQLEPLAPAQAVQYLLIRGQFSSACIAVEEAMLTDDSDSLIELIAVLQSDFPFLVRLAREQGQLVPLWQLVNQLPLTAEMVLCRDQLTTYLTNRGQLPADTATTVSPLDRHEQHSGLWLGSDSATAADVMLLASRGQWDLAIERVSQADADADERRLLRGCLLLTGRWADLATTEHRLALAAAADSSAAVEHWAYVLIAAHRAELEPLRQQAVEALSRPLQPSFADHPAASLQWRVLAMHGEIDAAVTLLQPRQPMIAVELLAQSGRVAEAFQLAGVPHDQVDLLWPSLAREAIDQARRWSPSSGQQTPEQLDRLLTITRLLYLTGRRQTAWEIYQQLNDAASGETAADRTTAVASGDLQWIQGHVLQAMYRINRTDWIVQTMIDSNMQVNAGMGRHLLAHVFDISPETVGAMAHALMVTLQLDEPSLIQSLADFLAGDVPPDFFPESDYQRLFDSLSQYGLAATPQPLGTVLPRGRVLRLTLPLATVFESHRQFSLAQQIRVELAGLGQTEAIVELAEAEQRGGHFQSAAELFQSGWQRLLTQRQSGTSNSETTSDDTLLLRVTLGQAACAAAVGNQDLAAQHWQTLDLIACSPSVQQRMALGQLLLDQQFPERATDVFRPLLPMLLLSDTHTGDFYTAARRLSQSLEPSDPLNAMKTIDLALVATADSTAFYPAGYVLFPALAMRGRVMAIIESKDELVIRAAIDELLRLMPIDIDFAENAVKKLRLHGMPTLADETIARVAEAGLLHMSQFPNDSLMGNNLAWVMALSDHRLDDALRLSQQTVFHHPDSTVYRDTLAEILFRRGSVDEAILLIEACLREAPGEWHSHEQLQRFRRTEQETTAN